MKEDHCKDCIYKFIGGLPRCKNCVDGSNKTLIKK